MDQNLNDGERELVQATLDLARFVEEARDVSYWVEDHTPPVSESDVLTSVLRSRQGSPEPKAGFTLWQGDTAWKVTVEPFSN